MAKSKYVIPSILAAGFAPGIASADDASNHISASKSLIDDIVQHTQSIADSHEFTLAQHRSHASHASHSSHRSGGLVPEKPDQDLDRSELGQPAQLIATAYTGRNEMSTPRQNVLPSSPQTAKKPKVLKGNTRKFGEIVSRAQVALMIRGYEVGAPSGELDSKTIAALYKYQRANSIPPTGKLNNNTLTSLGLAAQ